jgi:hypothetical protein
MQAPSNKILLFVDQFEEIFAYRKDTLPVDGGNSAALFVDFLLEAVRQPNLPLYIVLTVRTDYLGECAVFRGLAEALNDGQYLVPRLTRLRQQEAIEMPAQSRGVVPQAALVQRLLADSAEDPDKLPILQHLLKRLWEVRNGNLLDLALYERVGGWNGALELDAETVLAQSAGSNLHPSSPTSAPSQLGAWRRSTMPLWRATFSVRRRLHPIESSISCMKALCGSGRGSGIGS